MSAEVLTDRHRLNIHENCRRPVCLNEAVINPVGGVASVVASVANENRVLMHLRATLSARKVTLRAL